MWMDLEGIAPNEVSQLEKDKNHSISLMCKIQKQNKQNRKRLIDTENRLMVVRGEGVWRVEVKKGEEIEKYKLVTK